MEEITISINGRPTACPPGTSILQAAVRAGISIPTLCFHEQLKPYGACRMCLVEDEKSGRLLASCVAPVMPDMVIQTHSPRVVEHRRNIIRLMIAEHPESCIVCSKGNRCRLRQLAADIGLGETGLYPMPNSKPLEEANPFIVRDLSKCILCASCIRADHELVAVGAIDYNLRGFRSRPSTALEKGLEQSCCTFCGTCVSICPTGALSVKNERFTGTPETEGLSICGFCGVGCQLRLGIFDQNIVEVNPAQTPDSVNTATLCVRGHFAHDFLQSRQRLLQPWLKKDGRLEPAPWDEALGQAADRLLQIKNEHGPQSIGLLGSSKCSNEENYLFQKLARASLGTSHVDNGGYVYGQAAMQYFDALSQGMCRSMPLKDLEASDLIVVLGADPGRTVPVAGYAVKRAAERGVPVILANTLPTELDWFARLRLPLFSSNGLDHLYPRLLTALAAAFLQRQAPDSAFLSEYTRGFDQFQTGLARIDPRGLAKEINIAFEDLHRAADFLTGGKTAFVLGQDVLQQKYAGPCLDALFNLCLISGGLGPGRNTVHLIARENNLVGALDMGSVPRLLPGRLSIERPEDRAYWERLWKTTLSPDYGIDFFRMVIEAEKGNLKAMYIMGENPIRSLPQSARVQKALDKLELIIVQDILHTETTELAHILLPGAPFAEKGGTFTNMEGRIQSFEAASRPRGESREDWRILDELSFRLGQKAYGSLQRIRSEIGRFVPMYSAADQALHPGYLPNTGLDPSRPLTFAPLYIPEAESEDADFPYIAVIGNSRMHLGSGTRTANSRRIRKLPADGRPLCSQATARELNLKPEDRIRVVSRYGSIETELQADPKLEPGLIVIPLGFEHNRALNLIALSDAGHPERPESFGWTNCRVRLEPLGK